MKPQLVIGLGNPLMGDDGVGCLVAERLVCDPRLPEGVDVFCGGTDLLRYAGEMEGRSRVLIVDAIENDAHEAPVVLLRPGDSCIDARQDNVHQLSAVDAMRLIEWTAAIRCTLVGIPICSARFTPKSTTVSEGRITAILDRILQELSVPLD